MTKSGRRRGNRGTGGGGGPRDVGGGRERETGDCSRASPMTSSKVANSGHSYDFSQRMYSLENLEKMQPGRKLWARRGIHPCCTSLA